MSNIKRILIALSVTWAIFYSASSVLASEAVTYDGLPCAELDEELLNTPGEYGTVPTEHQWIARIIFKNDEERKTQYHCLAVLITTTKLLAPASCFDHHYGVPEAYSVELGVWNRSSSSKEWTCNDDGYCVPPLKTYNLSDIALHIDYDSITFNNNIAVVTLDKEVELSDFIQPVCARPKSLAQESVVGQYFFMGGFHQTPESNMKSKTAVRTISQMHCLRTNNNLLTVFTSTLFCGLPKDNEIYEVGAPLVGVHVENDEPKAFYLVGFMVESKGSLGANSFANYQDVSPYKDWIMRNIMH